EGPAGGEHELPAVGVRVDARAVPMNDGRPGDAERKGLAVATGDADLVILSHLAQEREVRVAMGRVDGCAGLARRRRALDLAGTEGECLAARSGEHDLAAMEPRHLDARDRPSVGPWPRLDVVAAGAARREPA